LTLVDVGLRDFGLRVVAVLTKQTYAAHQALQKMTKWKMTNEKMENLSVSLFRPKNKTLALT